jgi:hypothetical protein
LLREREPGPRNCFDRERALTSASAATPGSYFADAFGNGSSVHEAMAQRWTRILQILEDKQPVCNVGAARQEPLSKLENSQ